MGDTRFIAQDRNVWSPLYLQISEMKSRTETADTKASHTIPGFRAVTVAEIGIRVDGGGQECASCQDNTNREAFVRCEDRRRIPEAGAPGYVRVR